jgi:hypothetical protein
MKHNLVPIRPAMTAIAAVIALSSTPLLAQTAATPDAQSAPPVVAPPAPVSEPAAPAAVAQAAATDVTAPAAVQSAPQPAMKTMSTPVEHVADSAAASIAQSVDSAPARRSAGPAAFNSSHHAVRMTSTAPSAAPVAVKSVAASKTAAAPEAPAPAPRAAAAAPAASAPAASATSVRNSTTTEDETLPIAGAIGLGVIALGGAAYAMRRRKHRVQDDELLLETPLEAAPVVAADPVTVVPRAAEPAIPAAVAPTITTAGPDRLPNGFDLSRFGRHTRAAYRGPTPDNPSLSLRHRLRRASFFDQREREAAAAGATLKEQVLAPQQAQPAEADNGQVTIRLAPNGKSSRFGYVLQR